MTYTITADSKPDYDEWGPDDYWGAQEWMSWYDAMKKAYGEGEAKKRFITAYHEAGFAASSYDWRTFNSQFKKWAKDNGIYDALFDGIAGIITKTASTGIGAADTVLDTAGSVIDDAGKAIKNTTKLTKWLIPTVIIVVVVGVLWFAAKKYELA